MRKGVPSQEGQPVGSPLGHGHLKRLVIGKVAIAVLADVLKVGELAVIRLRLELGIRINVATVMEVGKRAGSGKP